MIGKQRRLRQESDVQMLQRSGRVLWEGMLGWFWLVWVDVRSGEWVRPCEMLLWCASQCANVGSLPVAAGAVRDQCSPAMTHGASVRAWM